MRNYSRTREERKNTYLPKQKKHDQKLPRKQIVHALKITMNESSHGPDDLPIELLKILRRLVSKSIKSFFKITRKLDL